MNAYTAAWRGEVRVVKQFLEDKSFDINVYYGIDGEVTLDASVGKTLLYGAVENCQPDVVRLLLQHGANVEQPSFSITPLQHAIDCVVQSEIASGAPVPEARSIARMLVQAGADMDGGKPGHTPREMLKRYNLRLMF